MTFLILALAGCGVSKSEHEALKRKVVALEKNVRAMERAAMQRRGATSGKGAKIRARQHGGQRAARPRGTVAVEGDAVGVFVASERHRLPVPGEIREGTFKALAVFESGKSPVEVGPITISANKTTTIRCVVAAETCKISDPE